MKKIVILSKVLTLGVLLVGCGGNREGKKKESDEDVLNDKSRYFSLNVASSALRLAESSQSALWSAKLSVTNEEGERVEVEKTRIAFDLLSQEIAKISVHTGDEIDLKVTAESVSSEKSEVLATNIEIDAQRTELTKSVWSGQCSDVGESSFKISLENLRSGKYSLNSDGKSINVTLRLCDFTNFLVSPVVSIEPQASMQLHNVVFRCEAQNDTGLYLIGLKKPVCKYGFRKFDETSVENIVPVGTDVTKEFRPEISFDFLNELGRDQYKAYAYFNDLSQLPRFATKENGCTKLDVVAYELANPSNEYRFHFANKGNGWVALNELGKRPAITKPSTLEFFLHCYWRSEAKAGSTFVVPFGN